jgi:hypothetical protein
MFCYQILIPLLRKQVAESLGKTTNKNVLPALEKAKNFSGLEN